MGHFRAMGTTTMTNLDRDIVKMKHSYFSFIFSYLLKIIGGMIFTLSGIPRCN